MGTARFLLMQKNTDGRVCLWCKADDVETGKAWLARHWPTHGGSGCGCYEGERKGTIEIHRQVEDGWVLDREEAAQ